jgi:hypothetical protein
MVGFAFERVSRVAARDDIELTNRTELAAHSQSSGETLLRRAWARFIAHEHANFTSRPFRDRDSAQRSLFRTENNRSLPFFALRRPQIDTLAPP